MDKTKHPLPENPCSIERGAVVECFFHLRGLDRHHEPSGNEVDHLIRHIVALESALASECQYGDSLVGVLGDWLKGLNFQNGGRQPFITENFYTVYTATSYILKRHPSQRAS